MVRWLPKPKKKWFRLPRAVQPGAPPHQPQPLGELHELRQRHGRHGRRLRLRRSMLLQVIAENSLHRTADGMWCRQRRLPLLCDFFVSLGQRRQIHARKERTFIALRQRLHLRRPEQKLYDKSFIPSPTDTPGPTESSETRRKIAWSERPEEVLVHLMSAIKAQHFDRSVVGAAMKRCEHGRWWDCLSHVRVLQSKHEVEMDSVTLSIYFTALSRCASGEAYGVRADRKAHLLQRAQHAWEEFGGFAGLAQREVEILLNSALHLCSIASSPASLAWAEELWQTTSEDVTNFSPTRVNYETFITVLSKCRQPQRVDAMLDQMEEQAWQPSSIVLAALVSVAGEERNAKRAEE
eukprot:symbB.v1.2.040881.t1/scaffold7618.1/size10217/1